MSRNEIELNRLIIHKDFGKLINYSVLTHLYLPIIQGQALSAYLWLVNEADFLTVEDLTSTLSRLANYLNVTKSVLLKKIFRKLEGVKLLETYLDPVNEQYLCRLRIPLSYEGFIHEPSLMAILNKRLNNKYIDRTVANLDRKFIPSKDAINVSCSFDSFISSELKTKSDDRIDTTIEFDSDLISSRLANLGEKDVKLSLRVQTKINFLKELYSFSVSDIPGIISYCNSKYKKLNVANITKAFTDIYKKRSEKEPEKFFELENVNNYIKLLNPIDFIKEHEERFPTQEEINAVDILSNKYKLNNEIINILLHYSLIKNREIVPNYILKIGETLYKRDIIIPREVKKYLKKAYSKANKTLKVETPSTNIKSNISQISNQELAELEEEFFGKK